MRSLFLTIFFGFWLSILAATALGVVITAASDERIAVPSRFYGLSGPSFLESAHGGIDQYDSHGAPALEAYFSGLKQGSQVSAYLFDARGLELTHRALPAAILQIVRTSARSRRAGFTVDHGECLRWERLTDRQGRSYLFVAEVDLPKLQPLLAVRVVAFLIVVTAACYGLTRNLTTPILILRDATKSLAEGRFDAQVGAQIGQRNDELGSLGRDFDSMAVRLKTLMDAHQRLLGDVSHELRSPLARLAVALALARRDESPQIRPSLDRIEREAERLDGMIGQLLALSRLETESEIAWEQADLCALVEAIAADASYEASGSGGSVVLTAMPGRHVVRADVSLLRSALENIVRNAVSYTEHANHVEIALRTIKLEEKDLQVELIVRDHGPGVPEEFLDRIFEPFFRVDPSRARASGGTGLGLAIASRAIRLHHGSLRAANAPDGGLIVTVRLPAGD